MYGKRLLTDFEYYLIELLTDSEHCVKSTFDVKFEATTIMVLTYILKEYDHYHNLVKLIQVRVKNGKIEENSHLNHVDIDDMEKKFNECLINSYEYVLRHKAKL